MKRTSKNKPKTSQNTKRSAIWAIVVTLLFSLLVYKLALLQLVDSGEYKNMALNQYTRESAIYAKRGTLYDRNYKQLAVSATVYNVFVSPFDVEDKGQINIIVNGLSEILGIDKNEIRLKFLNENSKYQIIKKSIEDAEELEVRSFIAEFELEKIIHLEEDTKRYYPFEELACHILGFVGDDNLGLAGLEYSYNEYLSGTNGRVVKATDAMGNPLPFKYESFIGAEDGQNLVTTLDYTVQTILEKYLAEAYTINKPLGQVTGVLMDVNTGEILGAALYPNFDLNYYNVLSDYYSKKFEAFSGTDEDKGKYFSDLLYEMWDNSIISKTFEPGSTFKIITSAMALEENVITERENFHCSGSIVVADARIHCHIRGSHGNQTFEEALQHSCNPAFVQIGSKVGNRLFQQYFDAFGYSDATGTDLLGEAASIYYKTTNTQFEMVELAVYSFGQTFKVNPLQHLRATSVIANGGYLVTPHVAKALVDSKGNTIKTFEFEKARQVVSKDTCDIISKALINSTSNANVNGYNIISKTGTSEKRDKDGDFYVSSCIAFAPAEDPQIALMILVDEPTAGQIYGSMVAAPVVSKVLKEVLPYLGIEPTHADDHRIVLANYIDKEITLAKEELEQLGIKCIVRGEGEVVTQQTPGAGQNISDNGVVVLYTEDTEIEATVKVPNILNSSPSNAIKTIQNNNLNFVLKGIYENDYTNCKAVLQSPPAGEYVPTGSIIEIEFRYSTIE